MLDTVCFDYTFSIDNFENIINALNNFALSDNGHKLKNTIKNINFSKTKTSIYTTKAFIKYGFTKVQIVKYYNNFEYGLYHLELVYKPALIIYNNDPYALSSATDLIKACNIFDKFINLLNLKINSSFKLPHINAWKIIRIDYAFQFSTPYAELYMQIFRKSNLPAKSLKYKTSLYYSNTATTINFYDKTYQLFENYLLSPKVLNLQHTIRLEVQCKKKYLAHIKEKLLLKQKVLSIFDVWNPKIAYNILSQKFLQLFGIGDFYKYTAAEEKINTLFKGKAKNILNLLLLSETHTLENIFEVYDKKYNRKPGYAKNQLRRALSENSINTLLLPDNSFVNCLPNPLRLLKDKYKV